VPSSGVDEPPSPTNLKVWKALWARGSTKCREYRNLL